MALKLILLRHAHAGDKLEFSLARKRPDEERPLSAKGLQQMKKISKKIMKICPELDLILSSPLVRAQETASFLKAEYKQTKYSEINELKPNVKVQDTLLFLQNIKGVRQLALVGHEPHLSQLLSFILTGDVVTAFDIKKGGFALVEFEDKIKVKQARLMCLVQPQR